MTRRTMAAAAIGATALLGVAFAMPAAADDHPDLAGRWTLNRSLSQFPRDVGFGMDLVSGGGSESGASAAGGGRGPGRSAGGGIGRPAMASFQESEDDAKRTEQLVGEVRNPSAHLTIVQTPTTVTVATDRNGSRTFRTDGREESQPLDKVPVTTIARWEATGLRIRYEVSPSRQLDYLYSRTLDPPQLIVQVQFIERGGHDTVTRVYEPAKAREPTTPEPDAAPERTAAPAPQASPTTPAGSSPAPPAAGPGTAQPPGTPGRTVPPPPALAQGPDADLKGLTKLGVVVEDLTAQAATCGLRQAPIETAVAKILSDAGFQVARNSDEDTYLYVQVITGTLSANVCVSRYDVYLLTSTTATLSYQTAPVLVQVSLLHKGGLTGGAPAAHGDAVIGSVRQYVDEFAKRIRDASR